MASIATTEPWSKDPLPEATPNPAFIYGMDVNYAAANAWYAYLPIENVLGKRYRNLNLHLTRFSLPQMQMQSTSISHRGVTVKIPTKVFNPEDKTLTLEYIVDDKWENYRSLIAWMSGITGTINKPAENENNGISPSDYVALRIYLLDNFKQRVIEFVFEDCWIETFNDIALEQNNPGEITHSFSFCYSKYYIQDIRPIGSN